MKDIIEFELWELKAGRLLLASLSFLLGSALAVWELPLIAKIIPFVLLFTLEIFDLRRGLLVLAAISMGAGLINADFRKPVPASTDISHFANQQVEVWGEVGDYKLAENGKGVIWLKCKKLRLYAESFNFRVAKRGAFLDSQVNEKAELPSLAISSEPREASGNLLIQLKRLNRIDAILISALEGKSQVRVKGKLLALKPSFGKPSHYGLSLRRKRVFSCIYTSAEFIKKDQAPLQSINVFTRIRERILKFHEQALGSSLGKLLSSMVLGDRAVKLDDSVSATYRICGLSHILAASGFNLSLIAGAIYFLLRSVTGCSWFISISCFLGTVLFLLIAGPSPSIVRAFIMGAFLLLGRALYRQLHMSAILAFSGMIVSCIEPYAISDLGFQLSYLSTAGLLILMDSPGETSGVFSRPGRIRSNKQSSFSLDSFAFASPFSLPSLYQPDKKPVRLLTVLHKLAAGLMQTLITCVVAQLCVLPLQLYHFRTFNPYFLPANLLILPVLPVVSMAGFLSSFIFILGHPCGLSPEIPATLDLLCLLPLSYMQELSARIAVLPHAQMPTSSPDELALLVYLLVLFSYQIWLKLSKLGLWILLVVSSLAVLVYCTGSS